MVCYFEVKIKKLQMGFKTFRSVLPEDFNQDVAEESVKKELKNGKAPDLQGWRYEMVKNAGTDLDESMLRMIKNACKNYFV